ncbi:MAG: hypothetical protein ACYS99_03890 [Planctomycetota bacterium]|jgi:hypothetical protein
MRWLFAALVLALPACDRFPWDKSEEAAVLDPTLIEKVVNDVLARISAAHEETGPLFTDRIPEIKNDAAGREGFEDWEDFKNHLRRTSPDLEAEVSRRITDRMLELLEEKEPPEEE